MKKNQTIVTLSGVEFSYGRDSAVLAGVSFSVEKGDRLGIIGPNGAGKSTLLALLNGVLKPQKGEIRILNLPLSRETESQIKQNVGLVFQNPEDQLFCPTVFEDVAFGPLNFGLKEDLVRQRVQQALEEAGIQGYERRSSLYLSFGEKKLVALATVLAMQPKVVALDEPTSNLDALHRRKIINWIGRNSRTCLMTSHDLDMIYETCNRTIILSKGKVVCEGFTGDILRNRQLLEENHLELPLRFQN